MSLLEEVKARPIMVVDDVRSARLVVARLLMKIGFQRVVEADCAEIALDLLKKESVGIVVTDVEMRGMGGIDLLDFIRKTESCSQLPVVVMTANRSKEIFVNALKAGASAYILKPFDERLLAQAIFRALGLEGHPIAK